MDKKLRVYTSALTTVECVKVNGDATDSSAALDCGRGQKINRRPPTPDGREGAASSPQNAYFYGNCRAKFPNILQNHERHLVVLQFEMIKRSAGILA